MFFVAYSRLKHMNSNLKKCSNVLEPVLTGLCPVGVKTSVSQKKTANCETLEVWLVSHYRHTGSVRDCLIHTGQPVPCALPTRIALAHASPRSFDWPEF